MKRVPVAPRRFKRLFACRKAEADELACQHGGLCLSEKVPFLKTQAMWKCANAQHPPWQATLANIKGGAHRKGTWCRRCHFESQRRYTIQNVRLFLANKEIALRSKSYRDTNSPIDCRCRVCKNMWTTNFNAIQQGHLCPKCAIRRKAERARIPRKEAIKAFAERGVIVVGDYRDSKTRVLCRCRKCDHEWKTNLNTVSGGHGCPKCGLERRAAKRRLSPDFVRRLLAKRKITLIKEYRNSSTPVLCRCQICRHQWGARLVNVRHQGQGCPKCAGRVPKSLADYQKLAAVRDGRILVMAKRAEDRSVWLCAKGHQFSRSYEHIKTTEGFCNICSGKLPKQLADYQVLAKKFSGQIEQIAKRVNSPSLWICKRGHEFRRSYTKIAEIDRFCPICSSRLGERLCRAAVEQLFGLPFPKVKLRKLRGLNGGYLELDAFNEELRLAVEHHGAQHFESIATWGGPAQLRNQREHDRRRRNFCRREGIALIEIRELGVKTAIEDLKELIKKECSSQGVPLPPKFDHIRLDLSVVSLKPQEEEYLARLKVAAERMGLTLLTGTYLGSQAKHELRCNQGHICSMRPYQVFAQQGCPACFKMRRQCPVKLSDGRVFESVSAAARVLGVSSTAVGFALKNRSKCRGLSIFRSPQLNPNQP